MSVISGIFGAEASKSAARAQEKASKKATEAELEMYYQSREDIAPWREAGAWALGQVPGYYNESGEYLGAEPPEDMTGVTYKPSTGLINMIEKGPGEFVPEEEPGYKFGYEEFVEKPTLALASARGRLGSGGTMRELTRYASDYASTKYDNFLDRWYESLTPYQSLAGVGQTTATQGAQNALATGQQIGQNLLSAGEARASGYINRANAISGASQNAITGLALANQLGWLGGGGGANSLLGGYATLVA